MSNSTTSGGCWRYGESASPNGQDGKMPAPSNNVSGLTPHDCLSRKGRRWSVNGRNHRRTIRREVNHSADRLVAGHTVDCSGAEQELLRADEVLIRLSTPLRE
jgi:hypothetical protein